MSEDMVKNRTSKQRIARFLNDPLLNQRLPWKLQQVYKILGSSENLEDCPELTKHFTVLQQRTGADFAIEILEMLHYISEAREDTASLMIISSAIKLLEGNLNPTQKSEPQPAGTTKKEPTAPQHSNDGGWGVDPAPRALEESQQLGGQNSDWASAGPQHFQAQQVKSSAFGASQPNVQPKQQEQIDAVQNKKDTKPPAKPQMTSADQLHMLSQFKQPAKERQLQWSSDEAEDQEIEDDEDENDSECPQPPKKANKPPLSSDGSEEDSDVDPDEMYNNLKHLEKELLDAAPETNFNDSYFDDAKRPKKNIVHNRIYKFGEEEAKHPGVDDDAEAMNQFLKKKKKQKNPSKPNKTHKPNKPLPLVKVPKTNLNPRDKEAVKRHLAKLSRGLDYNTAIKIGSGIDKITHEYVSSSLAAQVNKEKGRSTKEREADWNPTPLPEAYRPNHRYLTRSNKDEKKRQGFQAPAEGRNNRRGKKKHNPNTDSSSDEGAQDQLPSQDEGARKKQMMEFKPDTAQDDEGWGLSDPGETEKGTEPKPASKKKKNEQPRGKKQKVTQQAPKTGSLGPIYGMSEGPDSDYPGLAANKPVTIPNEAEKGTLDGEGAELQAQLQALINTEGPVKKIEYLTVKDLRKDYKYTYISKSGEEFDNAMNYLDAQTVVGFDTEFITKDKMPMATYIQFSTQEQGFIINLQHSQYETPFKERMVKFLTNPAIKKVGFAIRQDIPAIKRVFLNDIELEGFESIEQHLFLNCDSLTLGLTHICKRFYGKPVDKQLQTCVAEETDLNTESEIEYAALDALVPICLYHDYKEVVDYKCMGGAYMEEEIETNDFEFLVDPACKGLMTKLIRGDYSVLELDRELTHQQIIEAAAKTPSRVFITSDKYLILKGTSIKNKLAFSTSKRFDEGM